MTARPADFSATLGSLTGLARVSRVTLSENEKKLIAQTRAGRPLPVADLDISEAARTDAELARVINGNTRQLAGQFETSQAVLGALRSNALYRRPDNYWETIADRYRGMTISTIDPTPVPTPRPLRNPANTLQIAPTTAATPPATGTHHQTETSGLRAASTPMV